jgi:YbbR domain-containing protein
VEVTYQIPVQIQNLLPEYRVAEVVPNVANATFTGPKRAFYFFDPSKLKVEIDLSLAEVGRKTLRISEQNLRHPPNLTLQQLSPATIRVTINKTTPSQGDKGPNG